VRSQRPIEIARPRAARAHHDPRRAEAALRSPGRDERRGHPVTIRGCETFDRRHRPPLDARGGGYARDSGIPVDQHRATPALALRRAAVLHGHETEALAQHRQERLAVGRFYVGVGAVAAEAHA
jgi:hypothetical protein